jgi:hypothetical protein
MQLTVGDNSSQSIIMSSRGSYRRQIRNIQGYDVLAGRNYANNITLNGLGVNVG